MKFLKLTLVEGPNLHTGVLYAQAEEIREIVPLEKGTRINGCYTVKEEAEKILAAIGWAGQEEDRPQDDSRSVRVEEDREEEGPRPAQKEAGTGKAKKEPVSAKRSRASGVDKPVGN